MDCARRPNQSNENPRRSISSISSSMTTDVDGYRKEQIWTTTFVMSHVFFWRVWTTNSISIEINIITRGWKRMDRKKRLVQLILYSDKMNHMLTIYTFSAQYRHSIYIRWDMYGTQLLYKYVYKMESCSIRHWPNSKTNIINSWQVAYVCS